MNTIRHMVPTINLKRTRRLIVNSEGDAISSIFMLPFSLAPTVTGSILHDSYRYDRFRLNSHTQYCLKTQRLNNFALDTSGIDYITLPSL